jgi:hypothetical protein
MTTRALAILGLALASTACIDTTPQLFVSGICGAPDDPVACAAPAGKCTNFANGHLSIYARVLEVDPLDPTGATSRTVTHSMVQVGEIRNQQPPNTDTSAGRVNSRDAIIESATVSYSSPGLIIPTIFTRDLFAPVPAGGSAAIFLPILEAPTITLLTTGGASAPIPAGTSAEVIAHVKLGGHYVDGQTFETGPFDAPVFVINSRYDAFTNNCTDPTTLRRYFCYAPGQTGTEKCATR